jgi:hypothetical protein
MPKTSELRQVVVLIHGIRDHALWQQEIRDILEVAGFKVVSTNYGRFDLIRFLMPIGFFRKKAIAEVLNQLNITFHSNPGSEVSVIAHSFGTYIIGHILRDNFNLKFDKIILCGSVLKYNFPFEQFQNRFSSEIINEVGTKDIWPAFAESVTAEYGSAGTFGFHRPLIYDRWHNGAGHGYFLDENFCRKYWLPFLKDGTVVPDSESPEQPHWLAKTLSIFKLKYLFISLFLGLGIAGLNTIFSNASNDPLAAIEPSCGSNKTEIALFAIDVENAYKSVGWQLGWFNDWIRPPTITTLRVNGKIITGTATDGREVSMSLDPDTLPSPQHYGSQKNGLLNLQADCAAAIAKFFTHFQVYKQTLSIITSGPNDFRAALIGMNQAAREALVAGKSAICAMGKEPPILFPNGGFREPLTPNCRPSNISVIGAGPPP